MLQSVAGRQSQIHQIFWRSLRRCAHTQIARQPLALTGGALQPNIIQFIRPVESACRIAKQFLHDKDGLGGNSPEYGATFLLRADALDADVNCADRDVTITAAWAEATGAGAGTASTYARALEAICVMSSNHLTARETTRALNHPNLLISAVYNKGNGQNNNNSNDNNTNNNSNNYGGVTANLANFNNRLLLPPGADRAVIAGGLPLLESFMDDASPVKWLLQQILGAPITKNLDMDAIEVRIAKLVKTTSDTVTVNGRLKRDIIYWPMDPGTVKYLLLRLKPETLCLAYLADHFGLSANAVSTLAGGVNRSFWDRLHYRNLSGVMRCFKFFIYSLPYCDANRDEPLSGADALAIVDQSLTKTLNKIELEVGRQDSDVKTWVGRSEDLAKIEKEEKGKAEGRGKAGKGRKTGEEGAAGAGGAAAGQGKGGNAASSLKSKKRKGAEGNVTENGPKRNKKGDAANEGNPKTKREKPARRALDRVWQELAGTLARASVEEREKAKDWITLIPEAEWKEGCPEARVKKGVCSFSLIKERCASGSKCKQTAHSKEALENMLKA